MKNFFLKSRHKFTPIIILIFFYISALLLESAISYTLSKKFKSKITDYLKDTFGYHFTLKDLSFSFLKGFHLNDVTIFYDYRDEPSLFVKDAFVSINPTALVLRKIAVNKIKINELKLLMRKEKEGYNLQIIYSDICEKIFRNTSPTLNLDAGKMKIYIEATQLIYADNKNMFILLNDLRIEQERNKFKFRGLAQFNYNLPDKSKKIKQDIKINVQGHIKGENLNLDLITVDIGRRQMLGMGVNRYFAAKNPDIDIIFIPCVLSLDNFKFLDSSLNLRGDMFISLKFSGPLDSLRTGIFALLDNCSFRLSLPNGEIFDIRDFRGDLEFQGNRVNLSNGYLKINELPLNIEAKATDIFNKENNLYFSISLPKEFFLQKVLPLNRLNILFRGKLNETLSGNLEINALYLRKGLDLDMRAYFKNINFAYRNSEKKYFNAQNIELSKSGEPNKQKLTFSDLKSEIYVGKDKIAIKNINFIGYKGKINGQINLDMGDKPLLTISLLGLELDAKTLMEDLNTSDKLLSGNMNTKVVFNNHAKEFLEGYCYIQNGKANLGAFTEVVKLPPFKRGKF